ncbi:hypothetical protein CDAR_314461 [Caerostris darwini]|uniref:Uncharacterized protein n=1 Tax=Caerostris darwini TaxID=1538125 RepID=A0AAV4TNI2_9ARAC|nr:hypothetical protein CDAR_314461 [Caerostris darwini]
MRNRTLMSKDQRKWLPPGVPTYWVRFPSSFCSEKSDGVWGKFPFLISHLHGILETKRNRIAVVALPFHRAVCCYWLHCGRYFVIKENSFRRNSSVLGAISILFLSTAEEKEDGNCTQYGGIPAEAVFFDLLTSRCDSA